MANRMKYRPIGKDSLAVDYIYMCVSSMLKRTIQRSIKREK